MGKKGKERKGKGREEGKDACAGEHLDKGGQVNVNANKGPGWVGL